MRYVGIDPSTKTGFVALNESGDVIQQKELIGVGKVDPKRMRTMIIDVRAHVKENDFIAIEGFGFASQQAVQNGGIGWGIRMMLDGRKYPYYEVAPNALKKFVGVTGWEGETGNKKRLSAAEKKKAVINAIYEHYGLRFNSDNIADAFVLAKIAHAIDNKDKLNLPSYQIEVIETILNSPIKKPKKRTQKKASA